MAKESGTSKPTKSELVLDILATTLMDVFALAGIILMIPYMQDDFVGAIAVILILAVWGVAYTGVVIGEDRKKLKQETHD